MDYSIIVPIYNEEHNIVPLHHKITQAMSSLGGAYEVIFVDDGSSDSSFKKITEISNRDKNVRIIQFAKNFGQTAAISAGLRNATGEIIILIDADLQNDPGDIPRLIEKIREGYDLVSGWRRIRKDPFISRVVPSKVANLLISFITGVRLHDFGCTLKAYRRELLKDIELYGEMHRLLPVYASWRGASIAEIEVKHAHRASGNSKYGIGRTFKVVLDVFSAKFFGSFSTKPMYFFGGLGIFLSFCGIISGLIVLIEKYHLPDAPAHRNPLLLLAIFLFLVGFQLIMLGLLAELLMRIYYEAQKKPTYVIRSKINF